MSASASVSASVSVSVRVSVSVSVSARRVCRYGFLVSVCLCMLLCMRIVESGTAALGVVGAPDE